MAEVFVASSKSKVLEDLKFFFSVSVHIDTLRRCPYCQHIFLLMEKDECAICKHELNDSQVRRNFSSKALLDTLEQFSTMNLCTTHENQQLNLFCYSCEMLICVKCWFTGDHAEHKEHAVPLEEAYEHVKQNLTTTLKWINERYDVVEQKLGKAQEEKNLIDSIWQESKQFIKSEATPATMMQILQTDRKAMEFRSSHQDKTASVQMDRCRESMSEATVLIYLMIDFKKAITDKRSVETVFEADGIKWSLNTQEEEGSLLFYLCLIEGEPREYAIRFANEPEKVYTFDEDIAVKIGAYNPGATVNNDTQQLVVYIRRIYAESFQQLESGDAK